MNGGRLTVTLGSNTAYLGISGKSFIAYLCLVFASVITAAKVVSLPVPAVVGIAINKGSFLCTFKMPFILERDWFGNLGADRFGAIHAGTAAKPDNGITFLRNVQIYGFIYIDSSGIGNCLIVNDIFHAIF